MREEQEFGVHKPRNQPKSTLDPLPEGLADYLFVALAGGRPVNITVNYYIPVDLKNTQKSHHPILPFHLVSRTTSGSTPPSLASISKKGNHNQRRLPVPPRSLLLIVGEIFFHYLRTVVFCFVKILTKRACVGRSCITLPAHTYKTGIETSQMREMW